LTVIDLVLDTDVSSKLLKRQEPEWIRRALVGNRVWLTFVTVGELAKWAEARHWGPQLQQRVEHWMSTRLVIDSDEAISRTWGRLAGRAQLRGKPKGQNDTWIAACCIQLGIGLVTLNQKDFADFATYDGLVLLHG
jgi:toxin FitB